MARAARLGDVAMTVVEAVSITVPHADLWLLDALVSEPAAALDECLDSGILETELGVASRGQAVFEAAQRGLPQPPVATGGKGLP